MGEHPILTLFIPCPRGKVLLELANRVTQPIGQMAEGKNEIAAGC
jgi:hypothetical protein